MIEILNGKAYLKVGDKVYKVNGGGAGGINVESAKVGQTIKVKAVDENGKPTEWESADFPEELPVVELTTPVDMGTQFTDEENAALTAALKTGKPVIVKCTVMDTPDVTMVMNNFAGEGFVTIYADYNFLLVFDGDVWISFVEEINMEQFSEVYERLSDIEQRLDNMPSIITVASETDLPENAAEGTIAIVEVD